MSSELESVRVAPSDESYEGSWQKVMAAYRQVYGVIHFTSAVG